MISELKSAIGSIIPRANYIDAGTLGLKNLDANAKLEPIIADRLSTINRTSAALSRAQAVAFDSHQEAVRAYKDAEGARDRYVAEYEEAHHAKPDPDTLANLEREVSTARAAAEAANIAVVAATQRSFGTRVALSESVEFLNTLSRSGKTTRIAQPPKLKGAPHAVVVEQREIVRALDDELYDVEHALVPVEDAVAAVRLKVGLLAAAGRPRISVTHRGADVDLKSADHFVLAPGADGPVPIAVPDAAAFTAWLMEGALADKAEETVRARYGVDTTSLSAAERAKRLKEIADRRVTAEITEVAAVLAAWALGDFSVGLRADVSPVAVLSIAN